MGPAQKSRIFLAETCVLPTLWGGPGNERNSRSVGLANTCVLVKNLFPSESQPSTIFPVYTGVSRLHVITPVLHGGDGNACLGQVSSR